MKTGVINSKDLFDKKLNPNLELTPKKAFEILEKLEKDQKKICYECENYNHVDCTSRKKHKKPCFCWCAKKSSKYNLIMNKSSLRHG